MTQLKKPDWLEPYPWQISASVRIHDGDLPVRAEPGAGKTIAAFLCAIELRATKILIVAPPGTVANQWVEEASKFGGSATLLGAKNVGGDKLKRQLVDFYDPTNDDLKIGVLPWSRLSRKVDAKATLQALAELSDESAFTPPIDFLVVDESHYAQNETSTRTLALLGSPDRYKRRTLGLRHSAARIMALSGTPVTSYPHKYRAQFVLGKGRRLDPVVLDAKAYERKYWAGRMEYNYAAKRKTWVVDASPSKPDEHAELLNKSMMLVDIDALRGQLPAYRRELRFDDDPEKAAQVLPEEVKEWADAKEAGDDAQVPSIPSLEFLADIRREQTVERLPILGDIVKSWDQETKDADTMLIWCQYQSSAEAIADYLRDNIIEKTPKLRAQKRPRDGHTWRRTE